MATFPEDDIAVSNLLASDMNNHEQSNGDMHVAQSTDSMDIASEQTVETEVPVPTNIIKVTPKIRKNEKKKNNSLRPGRHIIGPGSKVVRLVKGGMIVSKKRKKAEEPEKITPDVSLPVVHIKQEIPDPSPLHELAELSMQHAQNIFKCEMCSEVFSDRAQLLVHVPIHI